MCKESAGLKITGDMRPLEMQAPQMDWLPLAEVRPEIGWWYLEAGDSRLVWSPHVKALFGICAEAPVTLEDFFDGLHPDDRELVTAAYDAAIDPSRRAPYEVNYRTIGKEDGVVRWVAARGRGEFDEAGRFTRLVGTAFDVTARLLTRHEKRTQSR